MAFVEPGLPINLDVGSCLSKDSKREGGNKGLGETHETFLLGKE